ncbi:hypothetical protein [Butyrivibrio sp. INlla14]|uniref:hypothetical protein n=1 Tax=Butyrivibrio sp. INlla14 TaxID=1520808 RepID=UPI0008768015|nr:hypothetical protein [Butyrivibrio sp. INlla14]SCY65076.1 hypothetical protein SAMN02910371_03211 [Butyrivibrio sp. INlla14]
MFGKIKIMLGLVLSLQLITIATVSRLDVIDAHATDELKSAVDCSFIIPPEFIPGGETGLFVNRNAPMESSTIKYSYYDNGTDKVLTNRQKKELEESGVKQIIDSSRNLTKEIYLEQMKLAYDQEFGQNVGFNVSSFENITIDGYPGYRIISSFQPAGEETIHQTVYIVLSKYRMFTISYQRAEDDDCEELFEKSAQTIHVK